MDIWTTINLIIWPFIIWRFCKGDLDEFFGIGKYNKEKK